MEILEIIAFAVLFVFYIIFCLGYYAMIYLSRLAMVAFYVLEGIGLSAMAKRRGIENSWLAWVPFASTWLLGKISDKYREKVTGEDPNLRKDLLIQRILLQATVLAFLGAFLLWYFGILFGVVISEAAGMNMEALLGFMMPVFVILLLMIFVVYLVIAVIYCISQYKALFDIYRTSDPKTSTLFFVLSFFSVPVIAHGLPLLISSTGTIPLASGSSTGSIIWPSMPSARMTTGLRYSSAMSKHS